jgi:hypothetical protein
MAPKEEPGTLETLLRHYRQIPKTQFKKYESKVAGNIGAVLRRTIPGIGTGNPGSILSGYVETGVLMILP